MTPTLYDRTSLRRALFVVALALIATGLLMFTAFAQTPPPLVVNLSFDTSPGASLCLPSACSLRAAIEEANRRPGPDVITFNLTLPATIELSSTLAITDGLTINGPADGGLTLDGMNQNRHFTLDSPSGPVNILSLTLVNGSSADTGGSIFFEQFDNSCCGSQVITNTLNLNTVVIRGGRAAGNGGAVYMFGSGSYSTVNLTLNLTDSTFSENEVGDSGGGLYISGDASTVRISNSSFTGNTATGNGGAIFNDSGTVNIVNSTLSGNSADDRGGAIFNAADFITSTVSIRSSTLTGNRATNGGGAIYQLREFASDRAETQIANTIMAGNTISGTSTFDDCQNQGNPGPPTPVPPDLFVSLGYNLTITGTSTGCAFTSVGDQNIAPSQFPQVLNPTLADNGGATQTHALLPGSPAIDRGGNCPPPNTDQRGVSRPLGAACDVGAYEAALAAIIVTKTVGVTPGACASTSQLTVDGGTNYYYCITIQNTGNLTLTNHTIRDPALGIDTTLTLLLAPGAATQVTNATLPALGPIQAADSVANTVTVTATTGLLPVIGAQAAVATASADVVVTPVYSVSLPSELPRLPVGLQQTVVATVLDHLDRCRPGLVVTFNVAGVNLQQRLVPTDGNCRAMLSYTSLINVTATDTITAWLDLNQNGIQDSGEPVDTVTAEWERIRIYMIGSGVGNNTQATRTITATVVTTPTARPVEGVQVGFTVSGGPEVAPPRFDDTNPQGQAFFPYTSVAPPLIAAQASPLQATDIITVWVDLDRDNIQDSGEPFDREEVPSAITLASFTATWVGGDVLLAWSTAVEIENAGFNLYRATAVAGPYEQINDQLIAAQGNGMGASYSFIDPSPGAGPFYYQLEDIDYDGVSMLHGPIEVQPEDNPASQQNRVYLPLLQR